MARKKLVTVLREAMAEAMFWNPDMDYAVRGHVKNWKERFGDESKIRGEEGYGPAPALHPMTPEPMLIESETLQKSITHETLDPRIVDGKWRLQATSYTTDEKFPWHEYGFPDNNGNVVPIRTTLAPTRMEYSETVNAKVASGFMETFAVAFRDKATKG